MAVTIRNILSLPSFQNAVLLSGKEGLDNIVSQVSISDSPITELDYVLSKKGDFYLSEFYFAKDRVEDMYRYLKALLETGSSGLCLIDEYIQSLPEEIISYCNQKKFPILLNSVNVPYSVMIREIMELIIADGQNMLLEKEITSMIEGMIDERGKMKILKSINAHFQNYITVFYVLFHSREECAVNMVCDIFERNVLCSAVPYKGGVLGLVSYGESEKTQVDAKLQYYAEQVEKVSGIAAAGISSRGCRLQDITKAIRQAQAAANAGLNSPAQRACGSSEAAGLVHYEDLGILRLLMLLAGQPELEEFSQMILEPLQAYDRTTNSQIYETMCTFHKNKYHYKKTAQELFVHENTIRYRISKAEELIRAKSPADDFREAFSIAIKCKAIAENDR